VRRHIVSVGEDADARSKVPVLAPCQIMSSAQFSSITVRSPGR
jgi:hypothetical protein